MGATNGSDGQTGGRLRRRWPAGPKRSICVMGSLKISGFVQDGYLGMNKHCVNFIIANQFMEIWYVVNDPQKLWTKLGQMLKRDPYFCQEIPRPRSGRLPICATGFLKLRWFIRDAGEINWFFLNFQLIKLIMIQLIWKNWSAMNPQNVCTGVGQLLLRNFFDISVKFPSHSRGGSKSCDQARLRKKNAKIMRYCAIFCYVLRKSMPFVIVPGFGGEIGSDHRGREISTHRKLTAYRQHQTRTNTDVELAKSFTDIQQLVVMKKTTESSDSPQKLWNNVKSSEFLGSRKERNKQARQNRVESILSVNMWLRIISFVRKKYSAF